MILTKNISTLANFQLFSSHLVCIDGPISIKNLSKLTPFAGGALKFTTQISPLLNYYKKNTTATIQGPEMMRTLIGIGANRRNEKLM